MKARRKGTDNPFREIEMASIKGVEGLYLGEELEFEQSTSDHWQDVRERAAIAAMQGLLAHDGDAYLESVIAMEAIIYADALVKELKGE